MLQVKEEGINILFQDLKGELLKDLSVTFAGSVICCVETKYA